MTNNNGFAGFMDKFESYRVAVQAVGEVAVASESWKGWADLRNQARRASVSVVLNLSEGSGYLRGSAQRKHFQRIALGSAQELEAALAVAAAVGLADEQLAIARRTVGHSAKLLRALCARH